MSFGGFGGGFGAATTAPTGGFGAAAPAPAGGFGAAAPASTGGFGAATTAPTGGFGAAATTSTGGFGAPPGTAGGFGASTNAAVGGFGAKPLTSTTGFGSAATSGGFGTGTASAGQTGGFGGAGGFGAGGGGFGAAGGFGGAATASVAPTAQQYPYQGIKGPGNATSWAREVDFAQVMEQVRFEALPLPLQQHLMELRSFMNAEREAAEKVYKYFNESNVNALVPASTAEGNSSPSSSSYRTLVARLAALKGGGNHAVELVAVRCNQHESQARHQLQRLDALESSIRDYEHHTWEPLREQGLPSFPPRGVELRVSTYQPVIRDCAPSPFIGLVEELSRRMEKVSNALTELEDTLVPPGRALRGGSVHSRAAPHHSGAIPNDVISQINTALVNELNQLRDASCVAAHLHSRTDIARELFTRQYGQAEADVLFADTEAQRNGLALFRRASPSAYFDIPPLPSQRPTAGGSVAAGTPGAPTVAPGTAATTGGGFGTGTGTGFGSGGFGVKPATTATTTFASGFGGTSATGGFGAPSATAASTATAAAAAAPAPSNPAPAAGSGGFGFGASAPGASAAPTAVASGFGAGSSALAPASTPASGFGTAPAVIGGPPHAPSMTPATPAVAPAPFALGGANSAPAAPFGTAPGKTAMSDNDDRPARRPR